MPNIPATFSIAAAVLGVPASIGFIVLQFGRWASETFIIQDEAGIALNAGKYAISPLLLTVTVTSLTLIVPAIWIIAFQALRRSALRSRQAEELRRQLTAANEGKDELQTANSSLIAKTEKLDADNLALAKKAHRTETEYTKLGNSLQKVIYQLYGVRDHTTEPRPRFNFSSIECTFKVNENGDARVEQKYNIKSQKDAHFWNLRLVSDEYAAECGFPTDINLQCTAITAGTNVEIAPLSMTGPEKRVALFFLPALEQSESRRFNVSFEWKGWFKELFVKKSTNWGWSYRSATDDQLTKVKFTFVFDAACGQVMCENIRQSLPGEKLTSSVHNGSTTWTYSCTKAPSARLNWELKFSIRT